jgi:hypothetical protein
VHVAQVAWHGSQLGVKLIYKKKRLLLIKNLFFFIFFYNPALQTLQNVSNVIGSVKQSLHSDEQRTLLNKLFFYS